MADARRKGTGLRLPQPCPEALQTGATYLGSGGTQLDSGLTDTRSNLDSCRCWLRLSVPQFHVCKGGIQIPASQDGCGHHLFRLIKKPRAGEGRPHKGLLCFPASGARDQPELTPASLAASDLNGLRSHSLRKCFRILSDSISSLSQPGRINTMNPPTKLFYNCIDA